jgi:hypothetical protein
MLIQPDITSGFNIQAIFQENINSNTYIAFDQKNLTTYSKAIYLLLLNKKETNMFLI